MALQFSDTTVVLSTYDKEYLNSQLILRNDTNDLIILNEYVSGHLQYILDYNLYTKQETTIAFVAKVLNLAIYLLIKEDIIDVIIDKLKILNKTNETEMLSENNKKYLKTHTTKKYIYIDNKESYDTPWGRAELYEDITLDYEFQIYEYNTYEELAGIINSEMLETKYSTVKNCILRENVLVLDKPYYQLCYFLNIIYQEVRPILIQYLDKYANISYGMGTVYFTKKHVSYLEKCKHMLNK
jgi:hypothetical protein